MSIVKKIILILGGDYLEIEIVKRAKALGYYTIVTDNHDDWALSPAKQIADEAWNISWADIDALEKECRSTGVNGVFAGFSEFRIEAMIKLCERLDLPCSLRMHQFEVTRDKYLFKETCRKYGVPVVPEYTVNSVINYPVIIKPVDRAGSIGINVAYNKVELENYYWYALSFSPSKHVIIEDFITDGTKFDVYYYVQNGKVNFLGSSDTIMCRGKKGIEILQKCWPFKSKYEKTYRQLIEPNIRRMFEGLEIDNAYATMSAFYRNGKFYFFEAGFRLSGELSFNYQEAITGINYINTMLKFSMHDNDNTIYYDIDESHKFSVVLNFFVVDGKVVKIKGLDELKTMPSVYSTSIFLKENDMISNSTNVFKKGAMVTIIANTKENLISTIIEVNRCLDIIGENGVSLIYERTTEKEIIDYYRD